MLQLNISDGTLLQRFVVDRDQGAFTTLVQRYARFVLGVCQRVLGDSHARSSPRYDHGML